MRIRLRKTVLRAPLAAAIFSVILAAAISARGVSGVLADSAPVPSNSFATASCWAAVKSLQKGTATSTTNGTVAVPIAAVDTTKSFLVFNTRHDSNRPVGSSIRGRIATSTSLEFTRVTDEASPVPIAIQWYVVEYPCGVNVQRGETAQTATTVNVPIAPVASLSQAFVLWSRTPVAADATWNDDDVVVADLTTTSNLQIRVNRANASHITSWQVVEFTNPADISVQRGSTSLLGTSLSTTATLGTPVDVNRTFVLVSLQTSGTGADVGSRMLRAQLTNSTTITIDRSISGTPDDISEIAWQAVELTGAAVQRGSENFPSGTAQRTVPIASVDTNRTIGFASVQSPGGQNLGRSPYAADDVVGVGAVTAAVSPTQLTLDRTSTAAAADIGWFVVELR